MNPAVCPARLVHQRLRSLMRNPHLIKQGTKRREVGLIKDIVVLYLLVLSADNLSKDFGHSSGLTNCLT